MDYKVIPISATVVSEVRHTLRSPQYKSLAAMVSLANGYGPCRSCLQVFKQEVDHRIYFTYNSFDGRSILPDPGPVFVHRDECRSYDSPGFPGDLLELPILFEAFGDGSRLLSRRPIDRDRVDEQLGTIFDDSEVRFVNMRNAEAGCFIAAIERDRP